jgi:hypothetical protein
VLHHDQPRARVIVLGEPVRVDERGLGIEASAQRLLELRLDRLVRDRDVARLQ